MCLCIYIYVYYIFGDGWFGERHKSCTGIQTAQTATEAGAHSQKVGKMLLDNPKWGSIRPRNARTKKAFRSLQKPREILDQNAPKQQTDLNSPSGFSQLLALTCKVL